MKKLLLLLLLSFTAVFAIPYDYPPTEEDSGNDIIVIGTPSMYGSTCYHGTTSNPYETIYAMVGVGYSCPEYIHPQNSGSSPSQHTFGDPNCQTERVPNNL